MATYVRLFSEFWTGDTGRLLRAAGHQSQVVALYLLSAPTASPIGIYYLPIPILAHEIGSPIEGASKAIRRVIEAGFAEYDWDAEEVYVPEMAKYQLADSMSPEDKRRKWVVKELKKRIKSRFLGAWLDRYRDLYSLHDFEAPSKPLRSPSEANSNSNSNSKSKRRSKASSTGAHAPQRAKVDLSDDEFVAKIKANAAYSHCDVDLELGRMDAWLTAHPGRKKSRQFVVNWLNRIEKPLGGTHGTNGNGNGTRHGQRPPDGKAPASSDPWAAADALNADRGFDLRRAAGGE